MLNRKLLEVISRLSDAERKQLQLFLASPYYMQGEPAQKIQQLYAYIIRYDADETRAELAKARVAALLYPEKPFEPHVKGPVDSISSRLFRLVRKMASTARRGYSRFTSTTWKADCCTSTNG
jgi:hypothetical protein